MHSGTAVTQSAGQRLRSTRVPFFQFAVLVLTSIVLWWHPIASTLRLALNNDAYTHLLLILPLTLALIYFNRSASKGGYAERIQWVGWAILIAALTTRLAMWSPRSNASNWLSLEMLALVLFWIGSVIACFGLRALRSQLFAFCFLFLMVPLPESAIDWLTEGLQDQSAVASQLLFRAARVPVTRDEVLLSIPKLDIEVARECSSIRSSTMLVIATLVLAHLFLRSWWRQILLVVISIPLSVFKNAVRIFTIAELGTRVDPSYLNGKLHHQGGIVFLALALLVDFLILWLVKRNEAREIERVSLREKARFGKRASANSLR